MSTKAILNVFLLSLLCVIVQINSTKTKLTKLLSNIRKEPLPTLSRVVDIETQVYPHDYFKGLWMGSGYTCLNKVGFMDQEVNIEHRKGELVAIKMQGDDCVQNGKISFKAILQDSYKECNGSYHIPCRMTLGSPNAPQSSYSTSCRIEILDLNTFKIPQWNIIFRRRECFEGKLDDSVVEEKPVMGA